MRANISDFLWLIRYGNWHFGRRRVPPAFGMNTDYYDGPIWWVNLGPITIYATAA